MFPRPCVCETFLKCMQVWNAESEPTLHKARNGGAVTELSSSSEPVQCLSERGVGSASGCEVWACWTCSNTLVTKWCVKVLWECPDVTVRGLTQPPPALTFSRMSSMTFKGPTSIYLGRWWLNLFSWMFFWFMCTKLYLMNKSLNGVIKDYIYSFNTSTNQ